MKAKKKMTGMKYKLISMTCYDKKEYTVYKVLCKKRWSLLWKGVMIDGSLHSYDNLHEWYNSKEDAINALKKVLKETDIQKNYPIIKEEYIEL
jgi:hypothetical protein